MTQNQGWHSTLDSALVKLQEKLANTLQISLVLHNFHHLQRSVAESNGLTAAGCESCRAHLSPETGTSTFPPCTKLDVTSELTLVKSIYEKASVVESKV